MRKRKNRIIYFDKKNGYWNIAYKTGSGKWRIEDHFLDRNVAINVQQIRGSRPTKSADLKINYSDSNYTVISRKNSTIYEPLGDIIKNQNKIDRLLKPQNWKKLNKNEKYALKNIITKYGENYKLAEYEKKMKRLKPGGIFIGDKNYPVLSLNYAFINSYVSKKYPPKFYMSKSDFNELKNINKKILKTSRTDIIIYKNDIEIGRETVSKNDFNNKEKFQNKIAAAVSEKVTNKEVDAIKNVVLPDSEIKIKMVPML